MTYEFDSEAIGYEPRSFIARTYTQYNMISMPIKIATVPKYHYSKRPIFILKIEIFLAQTLARGGATLNALDNNSNPIFILDLFFIQSTLVNAALRDRLKGAECRVNERRLYIVLEYNRWYFGRWSFYSSDLFVWVVQCCL